MKDKNITLKIEIGDNLRSVLSNMDEFYARMVMEKLFKDIHVEIKDDR